MKLIAVTNDRWPVEKLVEIMVESDPFIDFFIIREKSKTAKDYMHLISNVLKEGVSREKLIINDRVDVALAANIRRVQLPGHGLDVRDVKRTFPGLLAGCSIHSADEAEKAFQNGADWVLYGHVYETKSKRELPPRGLDELNNISRLHGDVYGIGGILPKHIPELKRAGVSGIAVMSSIFGSEDPASSAKAYQDACRGLQWEEE